jgi:molybdopterin-binding protein
LQPRRVSSGSATTRFVAGSTAGGCTPSPTRTADRPSTLADKALDQLDGGAGSRSARNHLTGLVTRVVSDTVMSQVELQCGRYRIVSLISTEAVQELGLEPGVVATAVIKATNVTIERNRA